MPCRRLPPKHSDPCEIRNVRPVYSLRLPENQTLNRVFLWIGVLQSHLYESQVVKHLPLSYTETQKGGGFMNHSITGTTIKALREKKQHTQAALARTLRQR